MIFCDQLYCRLCYRRCSDRIQVSFLTTKNTRGFVLYKVCFSSSDRAKALEYYFRFSSLDTYKGFDVISGSVLMVENCVVVRPYLD